VPEKVVHVDAMLRLDAIRPALTELLRRLEPTGEGNPPPRFLSRVVVRSSEPLGEGHVQLRVSDSRATRRGVAFRPSFTVPATGSQVEILYELGHSVWRDQQRVELMVRDLRLVSAAQVQADQLPV
jgi:single-stranded DNA-specific DHH superfamily exonuclease